MQKKKILAIIIAAIMPATSRQMPVYAEEMPEEIVLYFHNNIDFS